MARHVLFVVHGMGVHEADTWLDEVKQKLDEISRRYPTFKDSGWPADVTVVPVNYDDILCNVLKQWQDGAGAVSQFASQQQIKLGGTLGWLDGIAAEHPPFFWSHLADVVIYRFFNLYQERIRASVVRQIVQGVKDHAGWDLGRCTVLAHSLGTAVAHDALQVMATQPLGGAGPFRPPQARLDSIFMLANVSRLLQTDFPAYDSFVRPGPNESKSSLCSAFFDFRHELDPCLVVRRFAPVHFQGRYFLHEDLFHYRQWNIHGLTHYLDHPRVHIPLLNRVMGGSAITRAQMRAAVDSASYPQFGGDFAPIPALQDQLAELRALLGQLAEDSSLEQLFKVLAQARKIIEEIKRVIENRP